MRFFYVQSTTFDNCPLLNRIRPPGDVKGINRPVVLTGCKVLEYLVVEHHAIATVPQPSVAGLFSIGKNIQQAE